MLNLLKWMDMENTWLSLLPPLIAIVMAILTRQVILSLLVGIFLGALIIGNFNPYSMFTNGIEEVVDVFKDAGSTRNILFSLLIGAIIQLLQKSGAVNGFVSYVGESGFIKSAKQSQFYAGIIGILLFIESNISILTVGTLFKPIFRTFKISMQKLAYICDSSCAPVKVLIPINAWGAYIITHIEKGGIENSLDTFFSSMFYYFYPIIALVILFVVIAYNFNIGSMKDFESQQISDGKSDGDEFTEKISAIHFILPMFVLVGSLFVFLAITGNGDITQGSGSSSILYSVTLTLVLQYLMLRIKKIMTTELFMKEVYQGMANLMEIAAILMLAFAINSVCQKLQTGIYVAQLISDSIPIVFIPALIFIISSIIAFSTGTSWGTFAIMLSIAIPVATTLDLHVPMIIGAVISGGIFGDHCSPISDTTVISALASNCSHIDHVKTQLPYALLGGILTVLAFLVASLITI